MSEVNDAMKEFYKESDQKTEVLAEKTKRFTANASDTIKRASFGIVGGVLILAIILLNFVNVDFDPFIRIREFATNTVLLTICTFWFSINFGDYGLQAGFASDKYKKEFESYIEIKKQIQADKNVLLLSKFCKQWTEAKLQQDRQNELYEVGIDYNIYIQKGYNKLTENELKSLDLTDLEKIAIQNANSIGMTVLDPDKLLDIKRKKIKKGKQSAVDEKPIKKVPKIRTKNLASIIFNSIFAGGIVASTVIGGSLMAWALCILKIAIMVVFAFRGYLKHYSIIADETSDYYHDLTEYLKQFIEWCKVENAQ
ncbi:MAG: hypothetical protein AB7V00_06760 [Bacilli bacterium]